MRRVGFFVVPNRHLDELEHLHARIMGALRRKLWPVRDQGVFSTDECRAWADTIAGYERRVGGEAKLLHRIQNSDPSIPADLIAEIHRAFRQALDTAITRDAGYLSAAYDPDAEATLAALRAKEEARRTVADLSRPRQTREEVRADMQALLEWSDRIRVTHQIEEEEEEDLTVAWLCVVPEDILDEIRSPIEKAVELRRADRDSEARRLEDDARKRIAEAGTVMYMRKHGESLVLGELDRLLAADIPESCRPLGLYTAVEARVYLDAIRSWERGCGGRTAVIDALRAETHVSEHLAQRAYGAVKATLAWAVEAGAGFAWLVDTLSAYMKSLEAAWADPAG